MSWSPSQDGLEACRLGLETLNKLTWKVSLLCRSWKKISISGLSWSHVLWTSVPYITPVDTSRTESNGWISASLRKYFKKLIVSVAAVVSCPLFSLPYTQWRGQEFSFRGYSPGARDRKSPSPVGFRGDRGPGGRSLPEAEAVCRHCLQILTAETIKIWKFSQLTSWFLASIFHRGG